MSNADGNEEQKIAETVTEDKKQEDKPSFKKPILIGKVGRVPKKIIHNASEKKVETVVEVKEPETKVSDDSANVNRSVAKEENVQVPAKEKSIDLQYKEPEWSGLPESSGKGYSFDVLKEGSIIESIDLMKRPFWVFGRLEGNHIRMGHPTISRYHAVLQYRSKITDDEAPGFYIYDLGSTHGTYLNKRQLKPKVYAKVMVGHMLKFGCSCRKYILNGPEDDAEEESELTITELKKQREEELARREQEKLKAEQEREERLRKEEERGVDWGMGDDAEEESDLTENPFAQTNNEELYLDDPKKALRGFMEREGFELEYDCSEQGMGQFLCKVMLPLDDDRGRPIYAEVLHKGKKKEAVVQCALEACRILDRHGLLRQATHESRKRKAKNWEENDYYDSDEDTFLDRTGTIEKKRENRMKAKNTEQPETYQSLLEKEKKISDAIADIEKRLAEANNKTKTTNSSNTDEDSLDSYMKQLKQPQLDKQTISKLKLDLSKLKKDHSNVIKLVNIAKPADLPPLVPHYSSQSNTSTTNKNKLPIFGKRLKVKVQLPEKPIIENVQKMDEDVEEENEEEEMEQEENVAKISTEKQEMSRNVSDEKATENHSSESESDSESTEDQRNKNSLRKIEQLLKKFTQHKTEVTKIFGEIQKLKLNEDITAINWKIVNEKRRQIKKILSELRSNENNPQLEQKISLELNEILKELNNMTKKEQKETKPTLAEISSASEVTDNLKPETSERESCGSQDNPETAEDAEKKRKKNQRRIQQRQSKVATERQKGYKEDSAKEDYNMWVPPQGQTGDGKTSLNEKYGY